MYNNIIGDDMKKGFTLVEMLAVIAVLGLLVLLVLPNVLKNYRDAKKISFINEAKEVYTAATDLYVTQRTKGNKVGLIETGGKNELSLSNAEDLSYTIRLDSNGKVTAFRLANAEFCIVGVGDFLGTFEKEDVIDLSNEEEAAKCEITAIQDGQKFIGIFLLANELSLGITLKKGTILSTGTPNGVGMGMNPKKFLNNGDIIRIEIEDIGVLQNKCI
jgi:prepilin-type N-terminal cleavage/methylation domain-containing protein